jgi:uncharacterized membrane protein
MTSHSEAPIKRGILANIRNRIFAGILFTAPILATVWTFNFLLNLTTAWFPRQYFEHLSTFLNGYPMKLMILMLVITMFYLIGVMTFYFGKRLRILIDNFFDTIPIVNRIYNFIKSFTNWIENRQDSIFNSVVLIRYPHPNAYAIALVTAETPTIISDKILDETGQPLECVNVFIATTPNPTSGFFLIYPKRDITRLDVDVSTAMNLIISAGAVLPNDHLLIKTAKR